jgi:hypothetical protein
MAATTASSNIRASSLNGDAGPSTSRTQENTQDSDLNTSTTIVEVDDGEMEDDDDDEDYAPVKAKTSSPRKRPGEYITGNAVH